LETKWVVVAVAAGSSLAQQKELFDGAGWDWTSARRRSCRAAALAALA
jgi:hypothetical protein